VQTTFMNAQRGLGRGVVPQYELAWLFKIAQNVCHNRHQSARRRGRVEAVQDLDSLQDVMASPERSPGVSIGELTQALGGIPKRQRRALVLREFQGFSYEEIAGELGISVAAVETLLFRARRAVAQQLEQTGAAPARRRGAIASAFELVRWVFGGGAAPLKVAAITAAIATTATLTVGPVWHDGDSVPAAPKVSTPHAVVPARRTPVKPAPHVVKPASVPSVVPQQWSTPSTGSSSSPVNIAKAPTPSSSAPASSAPSPTTPTVSLPSATAPALPLPEVTVPAVTIPDLPLPEGNLPDAQLPDVQLPKLP
jgi:RNA polymerase sigma factor (sigma-70 family)